MVDERMTPQTAMLVVQGEGRGHLTQAMTVYALLIGQGIEICCVVVGCCSRKEIPAFFRNAIPVPMVKIASPNFVHDKATKAVRFWPTIWNTIRNTDQYLHSIKIIRKLIRFHKPDLIINFYEPLIGILAALSRKSIPLISIAHQNIYLHECFRFPKGSGFNAFFLRQYTRLTAAGADIIMAISMYDLPASRNLRIRVVPPILRSSVRYSKPRDEQYLLVYILNEGFIPEIMDCHLSYPETTIHCFTDAAMVEMSPGRVLQVDDTMYFHALDDKKFLSYMVGCSGVATTAGFETVCEARYMGKPVLMVPVPNHLEQVCNAADAERMGNGLADKSFRLERLLEQISLGSDNAGQFREWAGKTDEMFIKIVARIFRTKTIESGQGQLIKMQDDPDLKVI